MGKILGFFLALSWLGASAAWAGIATEPQTAQACATDRKITITAPYSGDDDGDGTLLIEWGAQGSGWGEGERLGQIVLEPSTSPFTHNISGLVNYEAIQLRLTYQDPDGLIGTLLDPQVITGLIPHNPFLHSSLSTGSSRWMAQGGWGIPAGKYGEFTCNTCHARGTGNVKMVKAALVVTDPASGDQLPIEAAGKTVVFQNIVEGSTQFGDDTRIPSDSSTNICEACHTQTKFHNFNVAANTGGTDHFNRADCINCHLHKAGFAASCGACHANPPEWGSHPAHVTREETMKALACSDCHNGAGHMNTLSEVRFGNDARLSGASYSDQEGDESSRYTVAGGYGAGPAYGTCGNLYCHSNAGPFDKANQFRAPEWGGGAPGCAGCHEGGGAATGLSGRHGRHTDTGTYAFACSKCHAATAANAGAIADPERHLNKQKDVVFSSGGTYNSATLGCGNTYCHSDGRGGPPNRAVAWSDATPTGCDSCHDGRAGLDATQMDTDAHHRLVNEAWIRKFPCQYCHDATAKADGSINDYTRHVNGAKDVSFSSQWEIAGQPAPSYEAGNKTCLNLYCHSDGTSVNPEVRDFPWDSGTRAACNSCHGHQLGECSECHADGRTAWAEDEKWKAAMPMYTNSGPGTARANSHVRHLQIQFSCENCHVNTVVGSCQTTGCHDGGIPAGSMSEVGHIDPAVHVNNRYRDVNFKSGGSYNTVSKRCTNTACHASADPQWGDSVNNEILCFTCHGTTEADVDDFGVFNEVRAKINMAKWAETGHGRLAAAGNYASGNPPANFPGNPCWYCHDNTVLHKTETNPFRLRLHAQYEAHFEKECVYCHMEGQVSECMGCHNSAGSLSPQLATLTSPPLSVDHSAYATGTPDCLAAGCHPDDASRHKTEAGVWTAVQKEDVKNQYVQMGVCLKCHDNSGQGRCTACHVGSQYINGFDPGTGFVTATTAMATSAHFGYKHFSGFVASGGFNDANGDGKFDGTWKGGKFCWDCHDPHGDGNIYMIHDKVATETDGVFGIPKQRADVAFTKKQSGLDYAKSMPPYNGICNVCHAENGQHYRFDYGDGHNAGRICTSCHEHRFSDSHASGQICTTCHQNKSIPRQTAFGLPSDCTKCHAGTIKKRTDILGQFKGKSHHVQGVEVKNTHCYQCHWEATDKGLINVDYHGGYNTQTHTGTPEAPADLVIWGPGVRPAVYEDGVTAVTFTAAKIGTADERTEVGKISSHCLGCHSDQNNETEPFGDCLTPNQYAWDRNSIAARYLQTGTTNWGKYGSMSGAAPKAQTKAFSAHGNAVANQGGVNTSSGEDGVLTNTRAGTKNVQCFDCHNSHGSYTDGVTSSYVSFDGSRNGANLKETQAGKGGYAMAYKAKVKTDGNNPMNPGAAQCFDCHETATAGVAPGNTPWGYQSTFGASQPIQGYRDSARFGGGNTGMKTRYAYRAGKNTKGGHLKASNPLTSMAKETIDGLCTPCHDPHGVSPSLGSSQAYAVPLLKGTWLSSPYKEDRPNVDGTQLTSRLINLDDNTLNGTYVRESAETFAGLCLRCHPKENLTDEVKKNTAWLSKDRIHETVKGWGNNNQHAFTCSKCHSAHASGLGRLMRTNCLNYTHRGLRTSLGAAGSGSQGRYPTLYNQPTTGVCHDAADRNTGSWPDNQKWNNVTPW